MPYADPARRREYAADWYRRQHGDKYRACTVCGITFIVSVVGQGRRTLCDSADCHAEDHRRRQRAYLETHQLQGLPRPRLDPAVAKARNAEAKRRWRETNRDRQLDYQRQWREAHHQPGTRQSAHEQYTQLVPVREQWPYYGADSGLAEIDAMVPKGIPEQIRADICQALCLAALEGKDPRQYLAQAKRQAYGDYAVSADWRPVDGYALADRFEAPDVII